MSRILELPHNAVQSFIYLKKIKKKEKSEYVSVYFLFYVLLLTNIMVTAFFLQNLWKIHTVLAAKL